MPFEYVQGMSDVVSVILCLYVESENVIFNDIAVNDEDASDMKSLHHHIENEEKIKLRNHEIRNERLHKDKMLKLSINKLPSKNNNIIAISKSKPDNKDLTNLLQNSTRLRIQCAVYGILKEKFIPLVQQNFYLYIKKIALMINMLKRKGIFIDVDENLKYMNHIFTFFSRMLLKKEDIHLVYTLILNEEVDILFAIMSKFVIEKYKERKDIFVFDNVLIGYITIFVVDVH